MSDLRGLSGASNFDELDWAWTVMGRAEADLPLDTQHMSEMQAQTFALCAIARTLIVIARSLNKDGYNEQ